MKQFSASLDATIAAGYLLELDHEHILVARQAQGHDAFTEGR